MLFAQIPAKLRRRYAADLKIDLKVVSTTLTSATSEETRYSKLELVESFLRKHSQLGSIDEPGSYFVGSLEMSWGPMFEGKLVYFGGVTEETILGLAGSRRHVIGAPGTTQIETDPTSVGPYLIEVLRTADPAMLDDVPVGPTDRGDQLGWVEAVAVANATTCMYGPLRSLEFLAKRVAIRRPDDAPQWAAEIVGNRTVVLGSPLFVAEAD
jgi:hypothetical protein